MSALDLLEEALSDYPVKLLERLEHDSSELYSKGKALLESKLGCKIVKDVSNSIGLMAMKLTKVELDCINVPEGAMKAVSPSIEEMAQFCSQARKTLKACQNKDLAEFWLPLFELDKDGSRSELALYAKTMHNLELASLAQANVKSSGYDSGIAITLDVLHEHTCRALVPDLRYFPKSLQKLTTEELMPYFASDANKLELVMLFIGRALHGAPNARHVGTTSGVKFNHNQGLIIYSREGGTGKTSFYEMLAQGMRELGYKVAVDDNGFTSEFGKTEALKADLVIADDLVEKDLKVCLSSGNLKRYITGSPLRSNEKGRDAITIVPQGVWACCTNRWTSAASFATDQSFHRRLCVIEMPTKDFYAEFAEKSGVANPYPRVWAEHLAAKYNVTPSTIIYLMLRHCLDRFMQVIAEMPSTESYLNRLKSKLESPLLDISNELLAKTIQITQLYRAPLDVLQKIDDTGDYSSPLLPQGLNTASDLNYALCNFLFILGDKNSHELRTAIKADYEDKGRPVSHPWSIVSNILPDSANRLLQHLKASAQQTAVSPDLVEFAQVALKLLKSNTMLTEFGFNKVAFMQEWNKHTKGGSCIKADVKHAMKVKQQLYYELNLGVMALVDDTNTIAKLSHLSKRGYNPHRNADYLEELRVAAVNEGRPVAYEV